MCKFFIKSCFDRIEAVKIAALKGIEFLFENSSFVLIEHLPVNKNKIDYFENVFIDTSLS